MAKVGTAYVDVKPDTTGFARGLSGKMRDEGAKAGRGFSSGFKGVGFGAITKGAAVAGLAIGAGLVVEAKRAVEAFTESEKVGKQTNATLKSTGAVANVSAKGIANLATATSRKTGIDDEAIQSSENLLLTFTNVRNEAGKGNRIFDRATRTVQDMSVALGQDGKSSAIQLGKALNDPIKGITALSRVGVSFTDDQKDQIKTLVKSGDTLSAQKIILRELNKEFGGSAEAQAQSTDKLKVAVGNIQESIGSGLKPAVDEVADSLTGLAEKALPEIEKVSDDVGKVFSRKDLDLGDKIKISGDKIATAARPFVTQLENEIGSADLGEKAQEAFEKGVPLLVDAAATAAPRAAGAFVNAFKNASPWGQLLTAAFLAKKVGVFNGAGGAAGGLFVKALKKGLGAPLARALRGSGEIAAANAAEGLASQLPASFKAREGRMKASGRGAGKIVGLAFGAAAAIAIGLAITDALKPQLEALAQKLANAVTGTSPEKNAAKLKAIAQDSHRKAREQAAATGQDSPWFDTKGRVHYVKGKTKTLRIPNAPRRPASKAPAPRRRPARRHRQEQHPVPLRPDQRFGERTAVIHVTTPVNDAAALAHKVDRLQGRKIRQGG